MTVMQWVRSRSAPSPVVLADSSSRATGAILDVPCFPPFLGNSGQAVARRCLTIALAAGEGTRMRSSRPKVLHGIAGRSLLAHVLAAVDPAPGAATAVVIAPEQEAIPAEVGRLSPKAGTFRPSLRRGAEPAAPAPPPLRRALD